MTFEENLTAALQVIGGDIKLLRAPLSQFDEWSEATFHNSTATILDMFLGAAVSGGTNSAAIPAAAMDGKHWSAVFLRSGTTANGGYRYQSTPFSIYFGQKSAKFVAVSLWRTSFSGRTVRLGFHDSQTVADAVDGVYFEILDAVVSAKTSNNSVRTGGATYTLSLDTWYRSEIDVSADGSSAQFRIYNDTTNVLLYDESITTNIPNTAARATTVGIVATEVTTTASTT